MLSIGMFLGLIQSVEANIHENQLVKTHIYFTLYIEKHLERTRHNQDAEMDALS